MTEQQIIVREAKEFYEWELTESESSSIQMGQVKLRLQDVYSPSLKALFLNTLTDLILEKLEEHRNRAHSGNASPECEYEIKFETLN